MHPGPRSPGRRTRLRSGHRATRLFLPLATLLLLSNVPAAPAATLTSIRVTPAGLTMAPEQTRQFFATAVYSDGSVQDITAVAEWTTGDSRTARVSQEHGSRGLVTARDPGSVEIRAALEHGDSKTKGATILTVFAGAVVEITTRPSSKNLDVGFSEPFKARARYAVNDYVGDVTDEVTWSSSDPSKATVDETGLVTPHQSTGDGFITITAHHGASGLSNSADDGQTRIKAAITHLEFDEDLRDEEGALLLNMGAGMVTGVDVYAHRTDLTKSRITRDITFQVLGPAGVVKVYADREIEGREAGDTEALSDGLVAIRAVDETRGNLTATQNLIVLVSGALSELVFDSDPLTTTVGERKTAKVKGRTTTGLETVDLRKVLHWTTGNGSIAEVGEDSETDSENVGKVLGKKAGSTTLTATEPNTGVSKTIGVNVRGAFTDVEIDPGEIILGLGMYLPLRANGVRSDGTKSTVTSQVDWEITGAGVASIDPLGFDLGDGTLTKGVLETTGAGSASVRALLNAGTPDEVASESVPITVEGTLVAIRVKPTNFKVVRDQRRKASLEGELSTGALTSDLAAIASWTVADTSIALVGNGVDVPDADDPLDVGEVLGLDSGVTTLSATEPISGLTSAEVDNLHVQGDVVEVEVDEANGGVVQVGTPGEYKARATFVDGSKAVISDRCEWSSDDESIATVDNVADKGMVSGHRIGGRTTIRVVCDGQNASGVVEVAGEIISLEISPDKFNGKALQERRFRAAANYEGGPRGDATDLVGWITDNSSVAIVDNSNEKGLVRFIGDGTALIIAVAPSGHVATANVTVTGGVTHLRVVPKDKTIRGSTGRKLKVIAELSDGDQTTVTNQVSWTSTEPDIARMSDRAGEERIVLGGSKTGTAILTASLPSGETGTTEITVDSLLTGLSMRPDSRRIDVGKHRRVRARGHFDDGRNKSVTRYVEFISDDPGIAMVESFGSKPGRVYGISPGTTTIRAVDPTTGIATEDSTTIEVVLP